MGERRELLDVRRLLPKRYIPEELGSKTRLHGLAIVLTLLVSTLLFAWAEGVPVLDSLYFIVMVMTLIGANFTPVTLAGKAVAIVVAVVSVGVILSFMTQVLGPAALTEYWEKLKVRKVSRMKNHVVVCGSSDTARALVSRLPKEQVLVVVKDKAVSESFASAGIATLHGDYETMEILSRAGVADSRAVVAASVEDSENAFVCLTSKRLAPNVLVIATVSSQENLQKLKEVRADHIISPAMLSADAILDSLSPRTRTE